MKQYILILLILLNNFPVTSYAGIDNLRKSIFPKGTMSNTTNAAIVKEQAANHLIGGSVVMRSPPEPGIQIAHVQSPSCSLGGLPCGAQFELLGGGVSLVTSQELMRHLKGLLKNAATYGGVMSIKTLCPHCEDIMEWLDSKSDWINQMAKTDCQDMEKLVNGMFSKQAAGSRATRQSAMVLGGEGKDMADVTAKSKQDNGDDPTKGREELKSQLGDNYNLVWKAFKAAGIKSTLAGGDDSSFRELLMSISGTIIGTKDENGHYVIKHKKSLIDADLIKEFAGFSSGEGSEIKLYKCNEQEKCLDPQIFPQQLTKDGALFNNVQSLLSSITAKIKVSQGPFSVEEESLISLSSLQLIPKIELDLTTYTSSKDIVIAQTEFIEALCLDVTTQYLIMLLKEVEEAVSELSYSQIADASAFKDFEVDTRKVLRAINTAKIDAFKKYDLIAVTKGRMKQEISYYHGRFEEFFSNQK